MKTTLGWIGMGMTLFALAGCGGGGADRTAGDATTQQDAPAPPAGDAASPGEPETPRDAAAPPDAAALPDAATPPDAVALADAAKPMIVEGHQVVRVIVRNTGYEPARIRLQAGMPAKFVFVQEATSHCASQIMIPAFGVPVTDLPQGQETVVEFAPEKAGTYEFTCGMNMMRGAILVTS